MYGREWQNKTSVHVHDARAHSGSLSHPQHESRICKNLTCARASMHAHTHSLSGQPSGVQQEVSPVRASCPALPCPPPPFLEIEDRIHPHTHARTHTSSCKATNTRSTHNLPPYCSFSLLCLHPSNPNLHAEAATAAAFFLVLINLTKEKWRRVFHPYLFSDLSLISCCFMLL